MECQSGDWADGSDAGVGSCFKVSEDPAYACFFYSYAKNDYMSIQIYKENDPIEAENGSLYRRRMAQPLDDFGILGADFNSCTIDIEIDAESGDVLTSQMKKPCDEVTFSLEKDI